MGEKSYITLIQNVHILKDRKWEGSIEVVLKQLYFEAGRWMELSQSLAMVWTGNGGWVHLTYEILLC
jgi:hypothetical protein